MHSWEQMTSFPLPRLAGRTDAMTLPFTQPKQTVSRKSSGVVCIVARILVTKEKADEGWRKEHDSQEDSRGGPRALAMSESTTLLLC
jgi:hypothetical protein